MTLISVYDGDTHEVIGQVIDYDLDLHLCKDCGTAMILESGKISVQDDPDSLPCGSASGTLTIQYLPHSSYGDTVVTKSIEQYRYLDQDCMRLSIVKLKINEL